MPPKYNVTMRVRVVAKQGGPEDVEYPIFKANMESLVKSPSVINAALNDKLADGREVKELDLIRGRGMGAADWLEKSLKTDYLLGPEILRVRAVCERFGQVMNRSVSFTGTESDTALLSDARRAVDVFGPPRVGADPLIEWVAHWVMCGGAHLGKPTHFESRTGRF
jgi:hypothetical protein